MNIEDLPEQYRVLMALDKNQALITQRLETLDERMRERDLTIAQHDQRISGLESRRWPANTVSIVMMIFAAVSFASAYLFR